jgi:dihydrodipicolinate synthase/N-acetylneuraminate lyase
MKKLELKFGSTKEMLSKKQMEMISGGDTFACGYTSGGTTTFTTYLCNASPCACQDSYDESCEGDIHCDDIDCGCK